jgi:RHS repeat-associated protein
MKSLVIFTILLIICMPISYAKVIDVPGVKEDSEDSSEPLRDSVGVKKFIYAGSSIIASVEGSEIKYYHKDRLSNRVVTDSSGNKVGEFLSLPFGQKVENSGVDYPFTGKEEDESSLYYFGARYYDDNLGRFISVDPIADNLPYAYVENNPMNKIDPNGMESWTLNQQNIFEEPPEWVSENFGGMRYNSLLGDVRDFNSEIRFYDLPFDSYGFSNSGTGGAWVDFGSGNLVDGMGLHIFTDFDLRRMAGEVSYMEDLNENKEEIAISIILSLAMYAAASPAMAKPGGKPLNFDLSKANRQSGSWLWGKCNNRVQPCGNAYCTDELMRGAENLAQPSTLSRIQGDHAIRHAQKIAAGCFEGGASCPLGNTLDETLIVLEQLKEQTIQQQLRLLQLP